MTTREGGHTTPAVPDAARRDGAAGVVLTLTDSSGAVVATTTTNENGEYRFRGLRDGTYTLTADSPRHGPVTQTVTVRNGTVCTHDLDLGCRCELTGIVRAAVPSTSNDALDVPTTEPEQPAEEATQQSTGFDDDGDQPGRRRRWGRIGLVTVVVAALVAGTGWFAWSNGWLDGVIGATEAAPAVTGPAKTAVVELGTIAATETWAGRLGSGTPFTVTGSGEEREGLVTRIAGQGATVARGDELYRLNERPVTLLFGTVPMYRDLGPGDSGADVKQLKTNLAKLGYDGFTVNKKYTSATAVAVQAWQADIGAAQTGTVARGDVVFAPKGGRVGTVHSAVGQAVQPGSPVLDITGSDQVVSLEVDVDDRDLVEVGTTVTVRLPGGDEVKGTVTAANVVQAEPPGGEEQAAGAEDSVTDVEVTLNKNVDEALLGSTVDVVIDVDERKDVLVVPVNALLARSAGGYGLEVVADDGSTSIVPVETGLFGGGKVEIRSDEVAEGTVVGVAGR